MGEGVGGATGGRVGGATGEGVGGATEEGVGGATGGEAVPHSSHLLVQLLHAHQIQALDSEGEREDTGVRSRVQSM